MKKLNIAILALITVLVSCKKVPEVNLKYVDVERDLITVGMTTATVQCDYQYIATLKKAYFYYGEGENEADMNTAEMRVVQNTLYVDLTGLRPNTTYSYYYEFYNGFNSMRTAAKTFKTEANNGGGDEPPTPPSGVPEGAINGLFSVSPTQKVFFSQGNLQYQASTNTWRFAEHQWDFVGGEVVMQGDPGGNVVGSSNHLVSEFYDGWIDLFVWGTSGFNHGAICYQPWSNSTNHSDYFAYGSFTNNLYDQTGQADWGYNAISNGGNVTNIWRTLRQEEMNYVFYRRGVEVSFVRAVVNGVNGVILLPDNWIASNYPFNSPNVGDIPYGDNVISSSDWQNLLEMQGAVFFPAAGLRQGTGVYVVNLRANYALSSTYDEDRIYRFGFDESIIAPSDFGSSWRHIASSVRLAQDATPQPSIQTPTVITFDVSSVTSNSAICGGEVANDGGATVTERGICWSTNTNPTINNSHVSAGIGTGSFSATMSGLQANTTYHVRAYATNSAGTAYGLDKEFTTLSGGGGGSHEWVNLDLPSGTLWATCNVGATTPEECGDYFAWGETQSKDYYDWNTYQYCNGRDSTMTKYCCNPNYGYNGFTDSLTNLLPEDDVATVNWGSDWRIPTKDEWQELIDNTTSVWTTQNGVNGRLFTDSYGNSLFLPAVGSRLYNTPGCVDNINGGYHSSSLFSFYPNYRWSIGFTNAGNCNMGWGDRRHGCPVRPVRSSGKK